MPSPLPPSPLGFAAQLRAFILVELAADPGQRLDPDTQLFESLLDSTSVLALVAHLEACYQIEIRDSELVPANFSSLRRLDAFLERKTQPAATPRAASG